MTKFKQFSSYTFNTTPLLYSPGETNDIDEETILQWKKDGLKYLEDHPDKQCSVSAMGNTIVICVRCGQWHSSKGKLIDHVDIIIAKNYTKESWDEEGVPECMKEKSKP